ncbi:MAG TPA: TetR/AcrR family transcriptional regulator [Saprospiraceae bacterium]|nr:TetR/AcrR family transcriptional regulator [Saprospiraceae bacterium]HMP25241.1 TetR/AcrR family transcriptional regulator [Saprospiraceae bacterium]
MSKSARTRMYIVAQAANLFNQKGYAGTSMDDIVQATGLSKGGVYGNFKSKEDIALAAFDHAVETVAREIRQRTKAYPHALDKLRAIVEFYHQRVLSPPVEGGCPIQNTAVEADDSNPALRQSVQRALAEWQQGIVYVLERSRAAGDIQPETDTEAFAIRFIATLQGAILLTRLYRDLRYFDAVRAQLFQMIDEISI